MKSSTFWSFVVWVALLVALWLAVVVVPVTAAEACELGGGEWNKTWKRCYP